MKPCPKVCSDIQLNLANRDWAFKNVGYGPANPDYEDTEFWAERAKEWNTTEDEAKTMRCGNCAAFIQTPKMMQCISDGLEKDEGKGELSYDQQFIEAANLGYCDLFQFTCAAARTCDAWKSGGPITKD